ncbi:MAG: zinc-binding alcohol dehydrogenase family protein [Planctomycetia bacterium]|nr:zinc-binding alcohol dehydrogenase family protein [Planctomycetia bacterium]
MKALQLEAPKQWKRIEVPEPTPGPDEALVRVHQVGICGTDLSGYLGKMPFFSYPRIPGHELGVEILAVGEGVTNVKPGDRCAVEPYINCQKCYACVRGHTNCCMYHQTLGVHCDGGLRPRFVVPARKLHVSRKLGFDQLALVETLAIGCHAVYRSGLKREESCLIIGAGPIGLSVLEFAKLTGAKVIVTDLVPSRLEFCRRVMGVSHTVTASEKAIDEIRELTDGHMPDVVIDATGNAVSMSNAFGMVAHAGRLVFVGITTDPVTFKHPIFHRPEGTLLCSRNALSADFTRIVGLIEDGTIDTRPWITHRTAFDGLIDVFPSYTRPETGVIKAIVEVGD